jgi:hypothetical protein
VARCSSGGRLAIWLLVVALAVEAWFPFRLELPVRFRSAPGHGADGSLVFDGTAALVGPVGPAWVDEARRSGDLLVRLDVRSGRRPQSGPARILTVTRDVYRANLMIGQDGADLVVRLRRPGSDPGGDPAIRAPGVLSDSAWHHLELQIRSGQLSLTWDGDVLANQAIGADPLAGWSSDQRVALGDEPRAERSWVGEVRRAVVTTPAGETDLLSGADLEPGDGVLWRSRVRNLASGLDDPLPLTLARLAGFMPVGFWLRRCWQSWRVVAGGLVGLALILTFGKAFVAGRHPSLTDAVLSVIGGLLGGLLALRAGRRTSGDPDPAADPTVR